MDRGVPISTLHLFSKLDQLLIELLKGLSADDWDSPTISPQWTVKDIAAHLLDGNLRTLSMMRDGYRGDPPTNVNSYRDLVNYLNDLNTIWVLAYKRISPNILIEQLETTGREYVKCLQRLEPFDAAMFSVAWAGEEVSENWFHIAREYTEKWHHQQQIREALGLQHPLMSRELLHPCLETFVRALPHAYREINAPVGTIIKLVITGEGGGTWFAERTYSDWRLVKNLSNAPSAATATIADSMAWKLFTKALTPQQAHDAIQVEGEPSLIRPLLSMVAVIA